MKGMLESGVDIPRCDRCYRQSGRGKVRLVSRGGCGDWWV